MDIPPERGIFSILFKHESLRRGETFVTRKINLAMGRIIAGKQKKLSLGILRVSLRHKKAPADAGACALPIGLYSLQGLFMAKIEAFH